MKFFTICIKRNFLSIVLCFFILSLVIFSRESLEAAKNGLSLWVNSVVPSLLPFFVATELLCTTNIIPILGRHLNFIMRPLFNVPGEGAFALVMGIISGYPVGAKIATDLRSRNLLTQTEAERLIAFTNNSGPLFIIGTVGISLFENTLIGFLLLLTHILACISVGICFRFYNVKSASNTNIVLKNFTPYSNNTYISRAKTVAPFGTVLSNSISEAINHVVMIGGFVVLFSVILSILNTLGIIGILTGFFTPFFSVFKIEPSFASGFISGLIELTNGVNKISNISVKNIATNILFCAFLLGFGGISVVFQVLSIISKTDISIKPYIYGKLLQGVFSCIYVYLFINFFPVFNLNL